MRLPLVIAAVAALILRLAEAGTEDHKYKDKEHVELWVNKVKRRKTVIASVRGWFWTQIQS